MSEINFYFPKKTVSVSLTGQTCVLDCPYCNKHYLKNMKSVEDPELFNYSSILVSGGINSDLIIPFSEYENAFKRLKEKNIKLNFHSGILRDKKNLNILKNYADYISFDFLEDPELIQRLYNNKYTREDYINTFNILNENKLKFATHIMLGIDKGVIKTEYKSIDFLADNKVNEIVFLILIPNKNTEYSLYNSPNIDEVINILKYARKKMKKISLGCMRPGGAYRKEIDIAAIDLGIDSIVMPHKEAVEYTLNKGIKINEYFECCVF